MYHICPARCQTQFVRGEDANRRNQHFRPHSAKFAVKLAAAIVSRLTGMDQGQNAAFADRLLNSGGAENHLSGLVRQPKSAERCVGEQAVDPVGKPFRRFGFGLE